MPRLVHHDTEEHIQSTGRTKWQERCTPPTTLPNVRLQTGGRRDSSGERAVCGARCPPSAADGRQLRPGDDGRWRCLCEKRPTLGPRMGTSLRRRWKKRTVCHRTAKRCRPAISKAEVKGMQTNERRQDQRWPCNRQLFWQVRVWPARQDLGPISSCWRWSRPQRAGRRIRPPRRFFMTCGVGQVSGDVTGDIHRLRIEIAGTRATTRKTALTRPGHGANSQKPSLAAGADSRTWANDAPSFPQAHADGDVTDRVKRSPVAQGEISAAAPRNCR
jgi:hypothetical protein